MSELRFEAAGAGVLLRADARLTPGLCVCVSESAPALATLVALAGGVQAPARGRVVFDGVSPLTAPATRRKIASLLAFEFLPQGGDVRSAVERVLRARGDDRKVDTMLATLGFLARAANPTSELAADERRSLALGLALHHEQARLLALFEPFAANHTIEPAMISDLLAQRAEAGAVVLVATTSGDVTAMLGGAHLEIAGGVLRPAVAAVAPRGAPGLLYVETRQPKRLVAALGADPAVLGVFWNEAQAPLLVTLSGADLEALGLALTRVATEASIPIERVTHSATVPSEAPPQGAQSGTFVQSASSVLDPQAARPPDQSVGMPTAFAEPTRPHGSSEGS